MERLFGSADGKIAIPLADEPPQDRCDGQIAKISRGGKRIIAGWILLAVLLRIAFCPPWVASLAGQADQSDQFVSQTFSPDAVIYVDVGPDGQPGAAGVDDGNDGVIDDVDETGATGTDDTLLVIESGQPPPSQTARRIGSGGWIAVNSLSAPTVNSSENDANQKRPSIRTFRVGRHWEAMVE